LGKKKQTTTQTNKPVYASEITGAARQAQGAYDQSQPAIAQVSGNLTNASNDLFQQFRQGDPTLQMAQSTARDLMQGGENPYLQSMIDQTNSSVRNQMQARLGRSGNAGGSDYTNLISRALARNETEARFGDFNNSQNRRLQAAGMAPGLLQGSYLPLQMASQAGMQGALLPLQAAGVNAGNIGGLLGQYQDIRGRTTQSGGLFESILGAGAQLGSTALMACDVRLKENIERIGKTPGGIPIYKFDYIDGPRGVVGPMAQEVAILQPEALGPEIDGFLTVDMGVLQ
jgi:hypothetical protein